MSNPPNPLDQYRSFSYHHFIVACNNTEALRTLQASQTSFAALSQLQHGQSFTSNGSTIVMIINSETDSKFFIESMSFSTSYVGMKPGKAMTMDQNFVITVKDTAGVAFLNFFKNLTDDTFQTSAPGLVFLLKTFFVGHTDQGTTTTIQLDPVQILIQAVESSFDATGGTHVINAVGMGAGAPLQDHGILYVNRNLNLVSNNNSIMLKDIIQNLESKLNAQLKDQFTAVKQATGGNGRLVKYKFTIPSDWSNYTVKCITKDNFVEKLFPKEQQAVQQTAQPVPNSQQKPQSDSDRFKSQINTNTKVTVIQILSEIFKHCDQIHQALVDNEAMKAGQVPKLHQVITSQTSDDNSVTIHFDTVNYYLPKTPDATTTNNNSGAVTVNKTKTAPTNAQTSAAHHAEEAQYGMIFDYIFTGKNSDILEFAIKANLTNLFMQQNRPGSNTAVTGISKTATSDPTQSKATTKQTASVIEIRKNDPVYLPTLTSEAQRGYIYAAPDSAKLKDDYVKMLALCIANDTNSGKMTIRGNPALLNQQIVPIMPHDDAAYQAQLDTMAAKAEATSKTMVGPFDPTTQTSYAGDQGSNIPILIKINIYEPDPDTPGKYIPYFYKGYYRVFNFENKFTNGEFTQELSLAAYDLNDLLPPDGTQ